MGSIERRLRALEDASDSEGGCPECGHLPGVPATGYEVVWADAAEEGEGPSDPEFCGMCGTQTTYTVTWEGLDD